MFKRISTFVGAAALAALSLGTGATAGATTPVPNGQRVLGRSVVEPVYDAGRPGVIAFISTPMNAPVQANDQAVSPIFLPVYPAASTVGPLICPHVPVDKCPDHGPGIAGLAQTAMPGVYAAGVVGHDHLTDFRGGTDFNVTLEPVVVLFTSLQAANEHLLTRSQVEAAVGRGDAVEIALPGAVLHAEQVPTKVWTLATPIQ